MYLLQCNFHQRKYPRVILYDQGGERFGLFHDDLLDYDFDNSHRYDELGEASIRQTPHKIDETIKIVGLRHKLAAEW